MSEVVTTVTAAIIQVSSTVLVAKRSIGKHLAGYWEFPGGKVEHDEMADECLERELYEELGVNVEVLDFVTENLHRYEDKTIRLLAYNVKILSGKLTLREHEEFRWIEIDNLLKIKLAPADIPIADYLRQSL